MVEYSLQLDTLFSSLSDPTRRDILSRVALGEQSIGELVKRYEVSFAAISKHLMIMERAKLIIKRKDGRKQMISLAPDALKSADEYLEQYRQMWQGRYDKLDALIK
jgi:DNA-binding transcriptional ArsR family regulator